MKITLSAIKAEMEYTTMPQVMEKLAGRFVNLD